MSFHTYIAEGSLKSGTIFIRSSPFVHVIQILLNEPDNTSNVREYRRHARYAPLPQTLHYRPSVPDMFRNQSYNPLSFHTYIAEGVRKSGNKSLYPLFFSSLWNLYMLERVHQGRAGVTMRLRAIWTYL
jgi:hypothetical protein